MDYLETAKSVFKVALKVAEVAKELYTQGNFDTAVGKFQQALGMSQLQLDTLVKTLTRHPHASHEQLLLYLEHLSQLLMHAEAEMRALLKAGAFKRLFIKGAERLVQMAAEITTENKNLKICSRTISEQLESAKFDAASILSFPPASQFWVDNFGSEATTVGVTQFYSAQARAKKNGSWPPALDKRCARLIRDLVKGGPPLDVHHFDLVTSTDEEVQSDPGSICYSLTSLSMELPPVVPPARTIVEQPAATAATPVVAAPPAPPVNVVKLAVTYATQPCPSPSDFSAGCNRRPLQLGNEVRLSIITSRDCYVYVLNLGSSGTVTCLSPNTFSPLKLSKANVIMEVPSPSDEFTISLDPPAGLDVLQVIATPRPIPIALQFPADFSPVTNVLKRIYDIMGEFEGEVAFAQFVYLTS